MVVEPLLAVGDGLGEVGVGGPSRESLNQAEPPEVPEAGLGKVIEDYSLAQVASN